MLPSPIISWASSTNCSPPHLSSSLLGNPLTNSLRCKRTKPVTLEKFQRQEWNGGPCVVGLWCGQRKIKENAWFYKIILMFFLCIRNNLMYFCSGNWGIDINSKEQGFSYGRTYMHTQTHKCTYTQVYRHILYLYGHVRVCVRVCGYECAYTSGCGANYKTETII